ncbi:MAG: DUF2378 family protein [Acidobacteriota bacterium]|jgi:hypothetical protein
MSTIVGRDAGDVATAPAVGSATDQVKGTKITSKLSFVRDVYGDDWAQRVLDSLAPEDREQVRTALEIGWHPRDLYERVIEAIVNGPGGGDERVLDRLGRHNAERQAEGAYAVYYRSKDPLAVLQGMAPMHRMLNRPGEMTVERQGDRHLTIIVSEPTGSPAVCRIAAAFYRRSVELAGAREVTVREVECSSQPEEDCCRFEVRWERTAG